MNRALLDLDRVAQLQLQVECALDELCRALGPQIWQVRLWVKASMLRLMTGKVPAIPLL